MSTTIRISKTHSTLFDLKSVHGRSFDRAKATIIAMAPHVTNIISVLDENKLDDFVEDRVILTVDANNVVTYAKVDTKPLFM